MKRPGSEVMRIKCLFNESPKAKRAPGKENVDSQINPTAVPPRPGRVRSVQKNIFLERRINTKAFLVSLEENH